MSDRRDPRPAAAIAASKRSFRRLLGLFVGEMFQGGGEVGADDLDLGIGITAILLALPGLFVSFLLFEKYGSLIRFLRGDGSFDPFEATIPDEYFFIVLSMAITGIATLWKWTAIFPDRRDFANLVHLPISLRNIFVANFAAIAALASLYAIVVNAPRGRRSCSNSRHRHVYLHRRFPQSIPKNSRIRRSSSDPKAWQISRGESQQNLLSIGI